MSWPCSGPEPKRGFSHHGGGEGAQIGPQELNHVLVYLRIGRQNDAHLPMGLPLKGAHSKSHRVTSWRRFGAQSPGDPASQSGKKGMMLHNRSCGFVNASAKKREGESPPPPPQSPQFECALSTSIIWMKSCAAQSGQSHG